MNSEQTEQLEKEILEQQMVFKEFFQEVEKVIIGQKNLAEKLLLGVLANGHILIEGLPGLAKTLAVKTFASVVQLKFSRIQFTPDMLPADLTGSPIYDQRTATFQTKKGPIFTNILLADEINRAPAKVQSALLEAMQERQVTIAEDSFQLEDPFLVLATQNTIEQDGTYPLPESQLDRFMMKVKLDYPSMEEEKEILERMAFTDTDIPLKPVLSAEKILHLRKLVNQVYLAENVRDYILILTQVTREPQRFGMPELRELIQYGVSPRGAIHLAVASRAYALIQGRGYVRPQDVRSIMMSIFGHRLIESYHARTQQISPEDLLQRICDTVEMP